MITYIIVRDTGEIFWVKCRTHSAKQTKVYPIGSKVRVVYYIKNQNTGLPALPRLLDDGMYLCTNSPVLIESLQICRIEKQDVFRSICGALAQWSH